MLFARARAAMDTPVVVPILLQITVCWAAHLRVGVFNFIPDLNHDGLSSYKTMIEYVFNSTHHQHHTVEIVVDHTQYSLLRDPQDYLSEDGFDLIEMDTLRLKSVVDRDLVIEVPTSIPGRLLPASVDAVTLNGSVYGYPTLVCGTFLASLAPEFEDCRLNQAQNNFTDLSTVLNRCKAAVLADNTHEWERLVGGRMNYDGTAWYPKTLYLDGYIDIHGPQSLQQAIDDLLIRGIVDPLVCKRLSVFVGYCSDFQSQHNNKCYHTHPGNYMEDVGNIHSDFRDYKTYLYFGYFENLAEVEHESEREPLSVIPVSIGETNHLLMFTDALVINKARWTASDEEKQRAIVDFVEYFTGDDLRERIMMGADLNPPRPRYLLQASESVYENTDNRVLREICPSLRQSVAAPSLTTAQNIHIHHILTTACFNISRSQLQSGNSKDEL